MARQRIKVGETWPIEGHITVDQLADQLEVTRLTAYGYVRDKKYDHALFVDEHNRYHINLEKFKEIFQATATKKQMEMLNSAPKVATRSSTNDDSAPGKGGDTYVKARTGNEVAKLQLAQLKIAEMKGSLLSADKVKHDNFIFARSVRDQLMTIPDRVSAILAAERDERKIYLRLTEEIKQALMEVTKILEAHDVSGK